MGDPKSDAPSTSAPKKPLSPAAERALAEAAVRRAERDRAGAQWPPEPESGRRSGELDPVHYGDWEVKGMATEF